MGGGLDDGGNVISSVISDWGVPLVLVGVEVTSDHRVWCVG